MKFLTIIILFFLCFQDAPFKPKEEFEIKLDYQFKIRPAESSGTIHFSNEPSKREATSALLPYLILKIKILSVNNAHRIKITSNQHKNVGQKKIKDGDVIPLDMGFTDDVKDQVSANEYTLAFLSEEREMLTRIVIFVDKDGTFLVNGEKRGKF
jgi:hypothetical protein